MVETKVDAVVTPAAPVAAASSAGPVAPKKSNKGLIIAIVVVVLLVLGICSAAIIVPTLATVSLFNGVRDTANDYMKNVDVTNGSTNNDNSGPSTSKDLSGDLADCQTGCQFLSSGQEGLNSCISLCEMGIYSERGECDKVEAGLMRSSCWASQASEKKDASYCDRMEKDLLQDGCYSDVAKLLKNKVICNKISNEFFMTSCIEDASN